MSDFAALQAKNASLQSELAAFAVPVLVTAPVVSGVGQVGMTLSCSKGVWDHAPASYAYQWKRGVTNVGTSVPTYTLVAADLANVMTCVVTPTNAAGAGTPATSNGLTVAST